MRKDLKDREEQRRSGREKVKGNGTRVSTMEFLFIYSILPRTMKQSMNLESKICQVIEMHLAVCVCILHLWLSLLKNMTKTNNMKTFFSITM